MILRVNHTKSDVIIIIHCSVNNIIYIVSGDVLPGHAGFHMVILNIQQKLGCHFIGTDLISVIKSMD